MGDNIFSEESIRKASQDIRPLVQQFMKVEKVKGGLIFAETSHGNAILDKAMGILAGLGYSPEDAMQIFSDTVDQVAQGG